MLILYVYMCVCTYYVKDIVDIYCPFPFLGVSVKLRKAAISFVMSVRLCACPPARSPVRMELLRSHRTDIHEIWYLNIFRKSIDKVQVSLKPDKNNGYFT